MTDQITTHLPTLLSHLISPSKKFLFHSANYETFAKMCTYSATLHLCAE
jgi:hypothetical protein